MTMFLLATREDESNGQKSRFSLINRLFFEVSEIAPERSGQYHRFYDRTNFHIMHEDGPGWLYVASGLQDGSMPTHYEPLELPVRNALYSRDANPAVHWFTRQENRFAPPGDPRFPFVLTTYRLTEHHTAGGMSRFLSHLAELQPELFAEMSPEL